MNETLRRPEPADYEAILAWVPDADSCLRWAGPNVPFPFSAAQLPGLLQVAGAHSYCLADGAVSPVAFGQHWVRGPGSVHLGRVIVAPDFRGRGYGRLLCRLLMAQAVRTSGAAAITLRVYRDNIVALSLYSSLGFAGVEAESSRQALFMRAPVP
ncbi:putative acetyltransferase [Burkholderiales bacterium]|nr:putative acetyltransferase [Burkholderiales bacterium]